MYTQYIWVALGVLITHNQLVTLSILSGYWLKISDFHEIAPYQILFTYSQKS